MDTVRPMSVNNDISYHAKKCLFKVQKDSFNNDFNRQPRCKHNKIQPVSMRSTVGCKRYKIAPRKDNAFRSRSAPAAVKHSGVQGSCMNQQSNNVKINEWIGKAPTNGDKDRLKKESATADVSFHKLNNQETILVKDIRKILQRETSIRDQKNIQLHKQWTSDVFKPLTVRLDAIMDQRNTKLQERQDHYQRYIDYFNKKGFVFLHTASTQDYDPIPKQTNTNTKVGLPLDPLEWQHDKAYLENEIANACTSGKRTSLYDHKRQTALSANLDKQSRPSNGMTNRTWLSMELYDIQSNLRQRSQMKMTGQTNATSADFWMSNYRLQNDNPHQLKKFQKRPFNIKHYAELF